MGRGSTRRWRTLRATVIRQEPYCQLRLAGCTDLTTTVDHIQPVIHRSDLEYERSNLQGACQHCNLLKGQLTLEEAIAKYGDADVVEPDAVVDFFG